MLSLKNRSKQLGKFLSSFLLVQMLIVLAAFSLANPSGQAAAQTTGYNPSQIVKVGVASNDNSLWVIWNDYSPLKTSISHFDADGKPLTTVNIASIGNAQVLGMDFDPIQPKFYYLVDEVPGFIKSVNSVNMKTGELRKLLVKEDLNGCRSFGSSFDVYYNPISRHLYIPCLKNFGGQFDEERFLIVDTDEGKILKTLDKGVRPIFVKAGISRLYLQKFNGDTYDIISWNAKTEEADGQAPLVEKLVASSNIFNAFQVNSRTGKIYLQTTCCTVKRGGATLYVFDQEQRKIYEGAPQVIFFSLINEVANQIYGADYAAYNSAAQSEQAAFSLANQQAPRLARYDWNLLAVDYRGYLYGQIEGNYGYADLKADLGLALVVVNPTTFSVMRTIQVRPPDSYYQDKAKRLTSAPDGFKGRFFPETGHTLSGKFLDYWEKNGGLARFGYPITEPFEEYNSQLAKALTVQYFERNRFEIHPENAGTQYEVLLGVLGRNFSAFTGPRQAGSFQSGETLEIPGGLYFKETGHNVTGKFYDYWKANGGLAQHGLPLTEPTQEVNPIDGKTYSVQYFERSRLEMHPENAGTQYEVLMGHFGVQFLQARGWSLPL